MCFLFEIISVFTVKWSGEAPQLYVLFRATGVGVGSTMHSQCAMLLSLVFFHL